MQSWPQQIIASGVASADQLPIPPRPRWRGFSFALHLLRVQGFCFALLQYSQIQAFTLRFVQSMQFNSPHCKTVHRALQWLFLRLCQLNHLQYQTGTSGYNATCATLERITAPQHIQHIPDTGDPSDAVQASTATLL